MRLLPSDRFSGRFRCLLRRHLACAVAISGILCVGLADAAAPAVDCARLQQQIAQADRGGGNRYAGAARKQAGELARTQAYARQLECGGGFAFFGGGNPQCGPIMQRIQQMQANLGQLQASAGGGGSRGDLVARFNAYCRGGQPDQPRQRGFFESLFGGGREESRPAPLPDLRPHPNADPNADPDAEYSGAHGGGQAVCVRTCDGGFFPLGVSARRGSDSLNEMCSALCPGTETAVFTRSPDADIKTAMGINGKPYMDMPNALKFTKSFTPACTCLPAGKTWAQALSNAEEVLGNARKGDIMVTPEKSDEMSRPKLDPKTRASLLGKPATAMILPTDTSAVVTPQTNDPDSVRPSVRQVGPQP